MTLDRIYKRFRYYKEWYEEMTDAEKQSFTGKWVAERITMLHLAML